MSSGRKRMEGVHNLWCDVLEQILSNPVVYIPEGEHSFSQPLGGAHRRKLYNLTPLWTEKCRLNKVYIDNSRWLSVDGSEVEPWCKKDNEYLREMTYQICAFVTADQLNARIDLSVARGLETCTKSISFSILTIRPRIYTFATQSSVSSLIKKRHSSHLARIQLRDMALKAQPWSLSPSHIKGALSTEPRL